MKSKNHKFSEVRKNLTQLDENEINIQIFYKNESVISRLIGLYSIDINGFNFRIPLRFCDYEGRFPSLASAVRFPFILLGYVINKLTNTYIMKSPKPFIVVDAVKFIEKRISKGTKVLEVGAGNSTLWFLGKGCDVTSVEHDEIWAKEILSRADSSTSVLGGALVIEKRQGNEALTFLNSLNQKYDVILVDCMNAYTSRYEVMKIVRQKLNPNGILVLDNSDGPVNWKAVDLMGASNVRVFTGYAYNCPFVCQTRIWDANGMTFSDCH
ncbi:hypothetical protein NBRC116493_18330 [Aurantivibrio infirmus]